MFIHEFRYFILRQLRNKTDLFWSCLFPLILASFFNLAFANITDSTETLHTIPVSFVSDDSPTSDDFTTLLSNLSSETDSTPLLSYSLDSIEAASALLEKGKITGYFTIETDGFIQLNITEKSDQLQSSILETVLNEFNVRYDAITAIASTNSSRLPQIIKTIEENINTSSIKSVSLTDGNMDSTAQYFFNLIAMACLFASFAGAYISIKNQANLSAVGARKRMTPTNHLLRILSEFAACTLIQFIMVCINICYILFVLNIDFGTNIAFIFFTAFSGVLLGVAFGFFVGTLGHMKEGTKNGILVSVSMVCSFLSGLMIEGMKMVVEENIPILNKINPAALISDSFYTLSIYSANSRYWTNIFSLFLLMGLFLFGGFMIIRREKYASL